MSSETTALVPVAQSAGAINAFGSEGSFESAQRMARALAASNLVPQSYRGNLADCLLAIELANRTGASVPMVMQNLDIIHGRPSWRSTFLIATVNACGKFSPLRWRWFGEEGADTWGARAVARSLVDGEECVGPLVTIAMAKAEGWYTKNGSKWKTMPELMLTYRSAAFWTRTYAPELSLGMLTSEEAEVLPTHGAPSSSGAGSLNARLALVQPAVVEETDDDWTPGDDFPIPDPVLPDLPAVEDQAASPRERYQAALSAHGIVSDGDRRALQKRLFSEGRVSSANVTAWTDDDYTAALAALSEIPTTNEEG